MMAGMIGIYQVSAGEAAVALAAGAPGGAGRAGGVAGAMEHDARRRRATGAATVSIRSPPSRPPRIDVLAGDTVHWTNDSVRVHTVTADDGAWASAALSAATTVHAAFDAAGRDALLLRAAPVHARRGRRPRLLLDAPTEPGAPGPRRTRCAGAPRCRRAPT